MPAQPASRAERQRDACKGLHRRASPGPRSASAGPNSAARGSTSFRRATERVGGRTEPLPGETQLGVAVAEEGLRTPRQLGDVALICRIAAVASRSVAGLRAHRVVAIREAVKVAVAACVVATPRLGRTADRNQRRVHARRQRVRLLRQVAQVFQRLAERLLIRRRQRRVDSLHGLVGALRELIVVCENCCSRDSPSGMTACACPGAASRSSGLSSSGDESDRRQAGDQVALHDRPRAS